MLKSLNDSLVQNAQAFQKLMKEAQGEAEEAKTKIVELEEQVLPPMPDSSHKLKMLEPGKPC